MSGVLNVVRSQQRIDRAFERAKTLPNEDLELQADFARYLTILVYGYFEHSVLSLLQAYVESRATPAVARYTQIQLRYRRNMGTGVLLELLGSFDIGWQQQCEQMLDDSSCAALDAVRDIRNNISHGRWQGVTLTRIRNYYMEIRGVVNRLQTIIQPVP